jgi:hypothetical protein
MFDLNKIYSLHIFSNIQKFSPGGKLLLMGKGRLRIGKEHFGKLIFNLFFHHNF